jgi:hypothetical protein
MPVFESFVTPGPHISKVKSAGTGVVGGQLTQQKPKQTLLGPLSCFFATLFFVEHCLDRREEYVLVCRGGQSSNVEVVVGHKAFLHQARLTCHTTIVQMYKAVMFRLGKLIRDRMVETGGAYKVRHSTVARHPLFPPQRKPRNQASTLVGKNCLKN